MAMKRELTQKLFIDLLVQWLVWQHVLLSAGQRRRMALSSSVSITGTHPNLVDLLSLNKNDSPLHLHQTLTPYIPGFDLGLLKKMKLFFLVGGKTHCALIAARASNVSTWET